MLEGLRLWKRCSSTRPALSMVTHRAWRLDCGPAPIAIGIVDRWYSSDETQGVVSRLVRFGGGGGGTAVVTGPFPLVRLRPLPGSADPLRSPPKILDWGPHSRSLQGWEKPASPSSFKLSYLCGTLIVPPGLGPVGPPYLRSCGLPIASTAGLLGKRGPQRRPARRSPRRTTRPSIHGSPSGGWVANRRGTEQFWEDVLVDCSWRSYTYPYAVNFIAHRRGPSPPQHGGFPATPRPDLRFQVFVARGRYVVSAC